MHNSQLQLDSLVVHRFVPAPLVREDDRNREHTHHTDNWDYDTASLVWSGLEQVSS